jgi:peptide/nickel transport system permease protein
MGSYIAKRILQTLVVLLLVSLFSFSLIHLLPGDTVYNIYGMDISKEKYEQYREELGLNKPMMVQYFDWITKLLRGDLGESIDYNQPVVDLLKKRMPVTLYFAALALFFSFVFGVFFGTICAVKRGTKIDTVITFFANIFACVPQFWVGIAFIYIFSVYLKILPANGFTWPTEDFTKSLQQTIMPLFCLSVSTLAGITRQSRSGMLEVIHQDYIRTAHSKGLIGSQVIWRHALKNSLVPVVTLMGMRICVLIGGSPFVEYVFNIPGIGGLLVGGIMNRDIPMVQALILIIATIVGVSNLVVDILYGYLDPRIRLD